MDTMNHRQLAAYIADAYACAGRLVSAVDARCTGSGSVVEITGTRSWRIVGDVEQYGHLATQDNYVALSSTGDRKRRIKEAVEALDARGVGQARAYERRGAAIAEVVSRLSSQLKAADLDPDHMFSRGILTPVEDIAIQLVDIAIGRIQHPRQGDTDQLIKAALNLVPADAFIHVARQSTRED